LVDPDFDVGDLVSIYYLEISQFEAFLDMRSSLGKFDLRALGCLGLVFVFCLDFVDYFHFVFDFDFAVDFDFV